MKLTVYIDNKAITHELATFQKIPIFVDKTKSIEIKLAIPLIDIQGCWFSELSAPLIFLPWEITLDSAAQKNIPFISFFNRKGENKFSFGSTNFIDNAHISAKMNQQNCSYDITFLQRFSEISVGKEYFFVIDSQNISWQNSLKNFREAGCFLGADFPASAFDPVYCTWYAVHAELSQEWVENNAEIAKNLGFKTFILDDGWCFDKEKRVNPETLPDWYQYIGDWELSTVKFPNWQAHRQKMRSIGLNYLFWVTPFLIGYDSNFYKTHGETSVIPPLKEGCQVLNINHFEACKAMIEKLPQVMKKYDLDGLKIDFIDSVLPKKLDDSGGKIYDFCCRLSQAIRDIKSNALIEFRESYNTPLTLSLATQFRVCDVPFDYMENFRRLARIRLQLGDAVPIHADPIYFHPNETAENVAKHFIAALVGVPMLSIELMNLKSEYALIIKTYLDFYYRHQETLNWGKWSFRYNDEVLCYAVAEGKNEKIVILNDSARIGELDFEDMIICNLSTDTIKLSRGRAYNYRGEATGKLLEAGGFCEI